jgi:cell division protein FtsQ
MTTLEVDAAALRMAVAPFPVVKSLSVSTQFPHGMRIRVIEQVPVADLTVDGRRIPVAADGTLLPSSAGAALASIPVSVPPGGTRVAAGPTLGAVYVLAAAPEWLRARVVSGVGRRRVTGSWPRCTTVPRSTSATRPCCAKWAAAAAVLADPGAEGAAYIDVTVPERPAAGGVASTTNSSSTGSEPSTLSGRCDGGGCRATHGGLPDGGAR